VQDTKHQSHLDGWRGSAILLLLVGHFNLIPSVAHHSIYTGRLGVECFFVLSGRLMAEILFARNTPIATFYQRRISRIFPALWVFVLALLMLGLITIDDAIKALTFTSNYFPAGAMLEHTWSLCIEEHSYVLLSILAVVNRWKHLNIPLILATLSVLCLINGAIQTWVFHRDFTQVFWHSDVRAASVLIGAALYLRLRVTTVPNLGWIPSALILIGFAISIPYSVPDPIKYSFGTFFIAAGLITVQFGSQLTLQILSLRPLTYFGALSFSLYLWQQPFYLQQDRLSVWVLLTFVALSALASFYLVERPARQWINSLKVERARLA
jgi:peptidoglycan/LPS O-acetylase OafA/YrhL